MFGRRVEEKSAISYYFFPSFRPSSNNSFPLSLLVPFCFQSIPNPLPSLSHAVSPVPTVEQFLMQTLTSSPISFSSTLLTNSPNTAESNAVLPIPGGPEAYKAAGPGPRGLSLGVLVEPSVEASA